MVFFKQLEKFFLLVMIFASGYIGFNWYEKYQFEHNPLSLTIQKRIFDKQEKVLALIAQKYHLHPDIPLIISDTFHSSLYGLTVYKDGHITVYLNKKRMKESLDYMVDEVIAHEYAHAILLLQGDRTSEDGHTQQWQKLCLALGGNICTRYVDNEEIIRQKMAF